MASKPAKSNASRKGALAVLIGATAAAVLVPTVQHWEGTRYIPYRDVVGIWTTCTGDTANVDPGKVYSRAECEARLERQLIAHAAPVVECVPGITRHPNVTAAAVSLAYNIGPSAFCRSTVAKRFNRGDWKGGCDAFLMWRFAGGREIRGLLNRRKAEREICLR
jgi:lysozyme